MPPGVTGARRIERSTKPPGEPQRPVDTTGQPSRRTLLGIMGVVVLAVVGALVLVTRLPESDHISGPTAELRAAAVRSLAESGFKVRFSGPGADPRTVGVSEFDAPDGYHFLPDPDSRAGEERLVVADRVYLRERSGRWVAYPLDDPHFFARLTFVLRAISTANDVSVVNGVYSFDDLSEGHPIHVKATIADGLIQHVTDFSDHGEIDIDYFDYGVTAVTAPDATSVDVVDSTAQLPSCLPEDQQDPNVVCLNSN
jgi:hypothetical protein